MKYLMRVLLVSLLVILIGCDNVGGKGDKSSFSKSDCDMKLKTSIWYATFDKGTYSPAELIIGTTIAALKLIGYELDE